MAQASVQAPECEEAKPVGLIRSTYNWVLKKSAHRHATSFLSLISFVESSVFPIPPDIMLIPMCLSTRSRSFWYATVATLSSVIGGVLGYVIGYFFFELVGLRIIEFYGYQAAFENLQTYFKEYGVWFVFIAGFTPIPYKIFTIGAGVFQMALLPFVLASIVGRGGRFFLLSLLIYWVGPTVKQFIDRYFNALVVAFTILLIAGFLLIKYL